MRQSCVTFQPLIKGKIAFAPDLAPPLHFFWVHFVAEPFSLGPSVMSLRRFSTERNNQDVHRRAGPFFSKHPCMCSLKHSRRIMDVRVTAVAGINASCRCNAGRKRWCSGGMKSTWRGCGPGEIVFSLTFAFAFLSSKRHSLALIP